MLNNPFFLGCSYQPRKLSFGNFGSLRKKKQDESEEYVCPMDVEMPKGRSFQKGFELQIYEDDLDKLEQVSLFIRWKRWVSSFTYSILLFWLYIELVLVSPDGRLWGNSQTDWGILWGHSEPDGKTQLVGTLSCSMDTVGCIFSSLLLTRACWKMMSCSRRLQTHQIPA